jgi:hypothetical protein
LDRETQKSEIYFTNHTLTGKPNAFPWLGSDTARRFRRPYGARHLYFTNCTLTGKPEAYSFWKSDAAVRPAGRAVSTEGRPQGTCRLYFTNHTLTGKQNAFPFQGSESGLGALGGLFVKLFFATCLPSLFHQSRFDWEGESLFAFDCGSRRRCHLSVAAPSPNFFHRSHFDWEPERFSVAAFGYRQAIPQA